MNLWNYIKQHLLVNPNQTVCEEQAKMSYEELVVFAEAFSYQIHGLKCCAIMCRSELAAAMALLGCFAGGVTAVPLSMKYGKIHCKNILEMIKPDAVITDINGELQVMNLSEAEYTAPNDHPALIMCTSGTTGTPKGVMLSEENVLTNIKDISAYLNIGSNDTILISRPLYHCAVLTGEFLVSLLKGVKICFYSKEFNPKVILDLISENQITVFCATPTLFNIMARFKRGRSNSSLKTICISGECMDSETGMRIAQAFPNADIYHVYGLTEASPRISYLPPYLFEHYPDSVGVPLDSVSLKILKSDGLVADINEAGVLWVKGGNIMLGYYNSPGQTSSKMKNGWLCTGDIAIVDENGLLKIKGRSDDLIIRAGMNIYPQEVEGVLKVDPRVCDVLVYKIDDPNIGVQIGLKISGDFSNVDEVKQLCIDVLPSFQVPSVIELIEKLPQNSSGKIIRRKNYV